MLYIEADHLADGIYNIKDGKIFKYKAKGGTVRTYEIGELVRCKECRHRDKHHYCVIWGQPYLCNDECFCSYGERKSDEQ